MCALYFEMISLGHEELKVPEQNVNRCYVMMLCVGLLKDITTLMLRDDVWSKL